MQGVEVCTGLSSPRLSSHRLRSARPTLRLEVVASCTLTSAKNGLDIGVHLTLPVKGQVISKFTHYDLAQ